MRDGSPLSPVRRQVTTFVTVGVVVLAVIAFGAVLASRIVARAEALRDAERVTDRLADLVVGPLLVGALAGDPGARDELDLAIYNRLSDGTISEVNVWRRDGTIVYADQARIIGMQTPPPDEVVAAIERDTVSSELQDSDEAGVLPENERFVEVYVPLALADGNRYAFEAYFSSARVDSQAAALVGTLVALAVVPLVVLQLVQLPIALSLARRVRRQEAERVRLLQRALSSSDKERAKIAADLHDGVVQDLAGAGYALAALRTSVAPERRGVADTVAGAVRSAVDELRHLMVDIYPPDLSGPGLAVAVEGLVRPLRERNVDVLVDVAPLPTLDPETAASIYRVARESLMNVSKHSGASHVQVVLEVMGPEQEAVRLRVCDDGVGIPAAEADRQHDGHFGIRMLSDRIMDLGGRFSVMPGPTGGTVAEAVLPLAVVG
jgi:two-component system NarL family sensor kinase